MTTRTAWLFILSCCPVFFALSVDWALNRFCPYRLSDSPCVFVTSMEPFHMEKASIRNGAGAPTALILPAILYPLCLYLFPEPRAVFGPGGARWVRTIEKPIAPVVEAGAGNTL